MNFKSALFLILLLICTVFFKFQKTSSRFNALDGVILQKNAQSTFEIEPIKEPKNNKPDLISYFEESSENGSFFDRSAAKDKIVSTLKTKNLSEVLRALPVTIHYELTATERVSLLNSFCRFKGSHENGFESLKVFLNRIEGFERKGTELNHICEGRV